MQRLRGCWNGAEEREDEGICRWRRRDRCDGDRNQHPGHEWRKLNGAGFGYWGEVDGERGERGE